MVFKISCFILLHVFKYVRLTSDKYVKRKWTISFEKCIMSDLTYKKNIQIHCKDI